MTGAELNDTTVASIRVEVDAPAEVTWEVVTDFDRYPEWNPFTVRVDTTGEVGADVLLHLPSPDKAGETFTTLEHVRVKRAPSADAPGHLQYDTADSIPGMLAVRDQWVEDLGDGRSSYRTTDVFTGEIAQVVFDLQAEWVKAGFDATALALKDRAEKLWADRR
jgi:hypothetical protein